MGKKTHYPAYSTGNVVVNGKSVASTSKGPNGITSSYNMSDKEKEIYNKVQSGLSSSLSNLFEISDEKQKAWDAELETYKKKGLKQIDSIYTPMETNLKNDIASRFGNFDNSVFMDNLNQITDKKAQTVADFSDELLTKQSDMFSNEMANRMNYITLLSNLNTIMNNNILSYTSAAKSNAESGNNYNHQNFTASNQAALGWYNTGLNTVKTGIGAVAAFV